MESEMLCLLLERLELSSGFNNLEKKTNRPHTSKITLLPSRLVISLLTEAKNSMPGGVQSPGLLGINRPKLTQAELEVKRMNSMVES